MGIRLAPLLAAPFLLAACSAAEPDPAPSPAESASQDAQADAGAKEQLLLFTSLPIYWAEGGVGDLLQGDAPQHWARRALETRYDLRPVDALSSLSKDGLSQDGATLLMVQPRALSPDENVALDNFVRAGGRVVLLADPMLDAHSAYGFGDRRRPAAIAMISPILGRWGLQLIVDEREDYAAQWRSHTFAVEEGGLFELTGEGHESDCALEAGGLAALCTMGEGRVLLLGDATFLVSGDHAGHAHDGDDHADGDDAGHAGEALLLDLISAVRTS